MKKIHQKELELDKIRNNIFHPFCLLEYDAFCTYYTQHSVSLHNCTMHYRVLNAKLFCFLPMLLFVCIGGYER